VTNGGETRPNDEQESGGRAKELTEKRTEKRKGTRKKAIVLVQGRTTRRKREQVARASERHLWGLVPQNTQSPHSSLSTTPYVGYYRGVAIWVNTRVANE